MGTILSWPRHVKDYGGHNTIMDNMINLEQRFLEHAQKVTDIYLKRLKETSDDWVPLWDMDDPRGLQARRLMPASSMPTIIILRPCCD